MKIILFTTQSYLIKEIKKSDDYKDIICISKIDDIFNLNVDTPNILFIHHLDCDTNINKSLQILNNDFTNIKLIAIRNNTNNIEGCSVLKKGYKAYINAMANISTLESIIKSVNSGNIWIYPELMQFLISSVPINDNQQNKLLKDLSIKELEVLKLIAQSMNNADISKILSIAEVTVKKHISMLFKKLNVKDRLSLALILKNYQ